MKKTLLALAIAATTAQAEITNQDGYIAIDNPDNYNATLIVNMNDNCVPGLGVFIYLPGSNGQGEKISGEISWRVDTRPVREIGFTATSTKDGQIADFGRMTGQLGTAALNDMRRGNTLRIKSYDTKGNPQYFTYSLAGFSRAFGKLKASCRPVESYFNKSAASNPELFL